jgi:hypothetical protein
MPFVIIPGRLSSLRCGVSCPAVAKVSRVAQNRFLNRNKDKAPIKTGHPTLLAMSQRCSGRDGAGFLQ